MIILSLRVFEKQSPVSRGDCFATCARNDMVSKVKALPSSSMGKELYYYSYPIRISMEGASDER
jgi:hypothetical protein